MITIVSYFQILLNDEVVQNEKFLKEGMDASILLENTQNTCRYCYDDLQVFYNLMDSNMYNLQKLATSKMVNDKAIL